MKNRESPDFKSLEVGISVKILQEIWPQNIKLDEMLTNDIKMG